VASNVYFQFIDSVSNLLIGSRVVLRAYQPPYFESSSVAYGGPIQIYSDDNGIATFFDLVPGVYKCSFSNANANSPSTNTLQNFANTVFYANIPDTSGSLVNGFTYIITSSYSPNNNNTNGSASYSLSSSYVYFDGDRAITRNDPDFIGINVGGTDVVTFLNNFFFPFVSATVSINSGTTYYEIGSSPDITVNGIIVPNDETMISTGIVYKDSSVWNTIDTIPPYPYSFADNGVTDNHSYQTVIQTLDNGNISSGTKTVSFIAPFIYGVSNYLNLSGSILHALTLDVSPLGNKAYTITGATTRLRFAYPAIYPDITKVLDPNLFVVTSALIQTIVPMVGLNGFTENYKLYTWNSVANFSGVYQFLF
jgi:hypothetical protein